ncbi:unnamed protein product, partial [Polarella glacialis]
VVVGRSSTFNSLDGPPSVFRRRKLEPRHMDPFRLRLHSWISWYGFDLIIGCFIVFNALTIGLETERSTRLPPGCSETCDCPSSQMDLCEQAPLWIGVCDYLFFIIYLAELLLRIYTYSFGVFSSHLVKLELFMVVLTGADLVVRQLG